MRPPRAGSPARGSPRTSPVGADASRGSDPNRRPPRFLHRDPPSNLSSRNFRHTEHAGERSRLGPTRTTFRAMFFLRQDGRKPVEPAHDPARIPLNGFMELCRFGEVAPSPDGTRAAFALTRVDAEENEYATEIWVYDQRRGEARRFTAGPKDMNPVWSPDGQLLAFLSGRGSDEPQVYVIAADGGEARPVSTGLKGAAGLKWAPDGSSLSITAWREEPELETRGLWDAIEAAGALPKDGRRSADLLITARMKYRYDGVGYTDDRRRHIARVALGAEPAEPEFLTDGPFDVTGYAWHPDGARLVFSRAETGRRDELWDNSIYELEIASREARRLWSPGGIVAALAWSGDGRHLAVVGEDHAFGPATELSVYVMETGDGTGRRLNPEFDRAVGMLMGDTGFLGEGV